jgi:hypothetical protein
MQMHAGKIKNFHQSLASSGSPGVYGTEILNGLFLRSQKKPIRLMNDWKNLSIR